MSGSRISYVCMDVRGALSDLKFPRDYRRMFKADDGRTLSPDEARNALYDELAKGHEFIPTHPGCGNPCTVSVCKGFQYKSGPDGAWGCPGYRIDENGNPIAEPQDAAP